MRRSRRGVRGCDRMDQQERGEDDEQREALKFVQRHLDEVQHPLHRKSGYPHHRQHREDDEDAVEDSQSNHLRRHRGLSFSARRRDDCAPAPKWPDGSGLMRPKSLRQSPTSLRSRSARSSSPEVAACRSRHAIRAATHASRGYRKPLTVSPKANLSLVPKPGAAGPNAMTQSRLEASDVMMTTATAVVRQKSFIEAPHVGNRAAWKFARS